MINKKLIKAIPGIIVGIGMTTLVVWGITTNKKCDKMLQSDKAIVEVAYAEESGKKWVGRRYSIVTIFKTYDEKISFRSTHLNNPAPKWLPVYVRYIPNCTDCYEFLWDSTVVTEKFNVRYIKKKYKPIDYEITYK